jgi:hypothetical protein
MTRAGALLISPFTMYRYDASAIPRSARAERVMERAVVLRAHCPCHRGDLAEIAVAMRNGCERPRAELVVEIVLEQQSHGSRLPRSRGFHLGAAQHVGKLGWCAASPVALEYNAGSEPKQFTPNARRPE